VRYAATPIFLALLLLLAGLAVFETGLLVLAVPLLVYLTAGVLFGPALPQLEGERELETERAAPGEPVRVRVRVTNRGQRLEEVYIVDQLPAGLEIVAGNTSMQAVLQPGEFLELTYTLRGRRGFHTLTGLTVTATDHLGLWTQKVLEIAPAVLVVLPQPGQLKQVAIRPQHTRLAPGLIPARRGGPGTDFFGLRDYIPGDSLRRINWKVSARRTEGLYSNDFEQERAADVGIILDARRRVDVEGRLGSLFEFKVTAAATLAEALLRAANRVSLLIYGGLLDWTFPGYGKIQQERILRVLANAHTDENLIFDRLEYLPSRVFPARSQLILISALHPEDLPILIRLRALSYAVSVISPDPVAYQEAFGLAQEKQDSALGLRLARLERAYIINGLRQAGIGVMSWDVSLPFDLAAGAALSRRTVSL
jgi:uncharacterized protein (DUF58 family)